MSGLVVDASVVMAWLFDDEENPRADKVLELLVEDGARWCLICGIWKPAILSSLRSEVGVSPADGVRERLDALIDLPIRTDEGPNLQSVFELARMHQLSFYDALYLELAKRETAALATLDQALSRAAFAEGLPVSIS